MEFLHSKGKYIIFLLLLAFTLVLPFGVDNSIRSLLIFAGLYTLVSVGLALLMGYAGQISLGQAAFYGIGAYSSAILTTQYGLNPWLAMLTGVVISVLIAFAVGLPLLKLEQHYLALATLAFGMIVNVLFVQSKLTGGTSGISSIPSLAIGPLVFDDDLKFYFLVVFFVVAGSLLASNIVDSRVGRALRAVHTSEVAARSMAVPVHNIKNQVFGLSAAYASIAGSLFAHYITFVSPTTFDLQTSIDFVVIAVIGGLASIWGPVLGAAAVVFIRRGLQTVVPLFFPNITGEYEIVAFGIIVALIMIFMPEGLVAGLRSIVRKAYSLRDKTREKALLKSGEGNVNAPGS